MPPKRFWRENSTEEEKITTGSNKKSKKDSKKEDSESNENIQYWLMKGEASSRIINGKECKFAIDDLEKMPNQTSQWDGVRNLQAAGNIRRMKVGDQLFFYHSSCKVPGIAGIAEIVKAPYPDQTALDKTHPYYDEKIGKGEPNKWSSVDIKFVRRMDRFITLKELQSETFLKDMILLRQTRLSVQSISKVEWDHICEMEKIASK